MTNTERIFTNKYFVIIFAIISCALWGSAFPVLKISYKLLEIGAGDTYVTILFAAYRFFGAGMLLFLLLGVQGQSLKLDRSYWRPVVVLGLLQITIQYSLFYIGLANTTGIKGAILQASGSFFTVILSHYIYTNDKINTGKIIGLVLGFAGVILVNLNSQGGWDFDFKLIGEGFLVICAVVSAIGNVVAKDMSVKVSPVLMTAYQMTIGSALLFLFGLFGTSPDALQFDSRSLMILVYLSFLSASAFALWYNVVKYNQLGKLAIYRFLIPVFGVIFSAMLLPEESLSFNVVIALSLVGLGIVAVNRYKTKEVVKHGEA